MDWGVRDRLSQTIQADGPCFLRAIVHDNATPKDALDVLEQSKSAGE